MSEEQSERVKQLEKEREELVQYVRGRASGGDREASRLLERLGIKP